ncbi:MAG: SH3 domain-containing protein [Nevskiales bacterium]
MQRMAETAMRNGDHAEAYHLWRQLAADGDEVAMYNIGWMYHNGYGLVIDDKEAAKWWRKAAKAGSEDAEQALGMLYFYGGKGVKKNLEKAAEYLMPGVVRGDEESTLMLETFIGQLKPEAKELFDQLQEEQQKKKARELDGDPLRISGDRVNLRSEPSTTASVVTTLKRGMIVAEVERKPEWVKVRFAADREPAWVYAPLVKRLD